MGDFGDWLLGQQEPDVKRRPWMDDCEMVLGTTENMGSIVDACIESGLYAIDLETSGLDNRVFNGATVDHIAGICLSPDGVRGWYIPVMHDPEKYGEHNVPGSVWRPEIKRLVDSEAVAIFHNGKFDHEFLQFNGGETLGEWDRPKKWEDTLILAYMRNTRANSVGLKNLSRTSPEADYSSAVGGPGLGLEMIDIHELWGHPAKKKGFKYDFTTLDPAWGPSLWYAASDAIITFRLYKLLHADVIADQRGIYTIEKLCVAATRWMERNRIYVNQDKVKELVKLGQQEWFDSIMDLYQEANKILGRDVMPGHYKVLKDIFKPDDTLFLIPEQQAQAKAVSQQRYPDPKGFIKSRGKEWPLIYDVSSPQQLGKMFAEMRVPGLKYTEKTGQVVTKKEVLNQIIERAGKKFPFMGKVKRFREIWKALGSYLYPMLLDIEPSDNTMRINFQQHRVDTGRFSTPSKDDARAMVPGWPQLNLQSIPSTYDPYRPESMTRLRECIAAPEGSFLVAVDYSGVELRIVTNLSHEPKWLAEFFHCSGCGKTFDRGNGKETPKPPPPRCPNCGSSKIGDLHTLTALEIYGADSTSKDNWSALRGNGKCVHPDTLIGLSEGIRPLRILSYAEQNTFQEAKTPISVWDGGSNIPVQSTYNGGIKDLFHVVTRRGILTCTRQHSFVRSDGTLASLSSGLTEGDQLREPSPPPMNHPSWLTLTYKPFKGVPDVQVPTTPALAYFAGVFLGDGAKGGTTSIGISHGHVDKIDLTGTPYLKWQEILLEATKEAGFSPTPRKKSVYLGSRHVLRFLAALNLVSSIEGHRILRIPVWVLASGREGVLNFLGGLFDTDGSVSKRDASIEWTTKDAVFAGQVAAILQALGLAPYMEPSWNKTYEKWYYRVRVGASEALQVAKGMRHPGKRVRLRGAKPGRRLPNCVLKVIPAGRGPVVDLSLDNEEHLYWANGHLTHNSTNFALCYGGGGNAVVRATNCDKNEGWRIKHQFDGTYKGLRHWWDGQHAFAKEHGYVKTGFGRKYPVPDINNADGFFRSKAERNSVNGPVQGCLDPRSRIPTSLGVLPVGDLWSRQEDGDFTGFKVWTGREWADGKALYSGPKELVQTTFESGRVLRTSPEHLFRVLRIPGGSSLTGHHSFPEYFAWIHQEELTTEDWVAVNSHPEFLSETLSLGESFPPSLVTWVGDLVRGSSAYGDLSRSQKSAVYRLQAGSGSKPQCLKYLNKIPDNEVPSVLWDLLEYDYERLVKVERTGEKVKMYDIEVFDEDHAFTCDGAIVHNTSADITKIAMGLVYKECKKRGWLDKAKMIITMHDELVFLIQGEILEEAIDVIVPIMTRNKLLLGKKWPIPLTTDVEIGHDWTVPWDISKMRAGDYKFIGNTKYKSPDDIPEGYDWEKLPSFPSDLAPFFKRKTPDGLPAPNVSTDHVGTISPQPNEKEGGNNVEEKTIPVSGTGLEEPPPVIDSPPVRTPPEPIPSTGGDCVFRLEAPLTMTTILRLADVIRQCRDGGTKKLRVYSASGDSFDGWEELFGHSEVRVSSQEFHILARAKGI